MRPPTLPNHTPAGHILIRPPPGAPLLGPTTESTRRSGRSRLAVACLSRQRTSTAEEPRVGAVCASKCSSQYPDGPERYVSEFQSGVAERMAVSRAPFQPAKNSEWGTPMLPMSKKFTRGRRCLRSSLIFAMSTCASASSSSRSAAVKGRALGA